MLFFLLGLPKSVRVKTKMNQFQFNFICLRWNFSHIFLSVCPEPKDSWSNLWKKKMKYFDEHSWIPTGACESIMRRQNKRNSEWPSRTRERKRTNTCTMDIKFLVGTVCKHSKRKNKADKTHTPHRKKENVTNYAAIKVIFFCVSLPSSPKPDETERKPEPIQANEKNICQNER